MKKLRDSIDYTIKTLTKPSAIALFGLSSLIALPASYIKNKGEEVYRGEINDYEVVFEKGIWSSTAASQMNKNKLTAKKDGETYIFEDCINENDSINNRGLEWITVMSEDNKETLSNEGVHYKWLIPPFNNYESTISKSTFDKYEPLYESLIKGIKKELK